MSKRKKSAPSTDSLAEPGPVSAAGNLPPSLRFEPVAERFPALEEQEVKLTFVSSTARTVQVAGTFSDWQPQPMEHTGAGEWTARLQLKSGVYEYRFVVDGVWTDDPDAEKTAPNPHGSHNAVIKVGLDDRTDLL